MLSVQENYESKLDCKLTRFPNAFCSGIGTKKKNSTRESGPESADSKDIDLDLYTLVKPGGRKLL